MRPEEFVPGVVKDTPDSRDWVYAKVTLPVALPKRVCWQLHGKARDQGNWGTCVGFAGAQGKELYTYHKRRQRQVYSPRFLYTLCKRYDDLPAGTEGTTMRALAKVLTKYGVCTEEYMPYMPSLRTLYSPTPDALKDAEQRRIQGYARCQTPQEIKQAVAQEGPLPFAMLITSNFFEAQNGVVPREYKGTLLGGHAMVIIGYDDEKEWYIVLNSWGVSTPYTDENGLNYIPYSYMHAKIKDFGDMPVLMDAWAMLLNIEKNLNPRIELWIGKEKAIVDGKEVLLDAAPEIKNNRTMVPIRFVSEVLGRKVTWIRSEQKVVIE